MPNDQWPTPNVQRNRAVVLTPPGTGAIAVVRILGQSRTAEFLREHFSGKAIAGRCVHGEIRTGGAAAMDDAVVVLAPEGDFVDVNLHGGAWVIRSFLDLLRGNGFEIIERAAGPASDEAVDGTTALEREVHAHLPLARTELALRALLAQPPAWEQFKKSLTQHSALSTQHSIASILADRSLITLLQPPRVAIIGAPNAGKSTLANQLFAQQRSITADLPGTTRDWVGEIANIEGLAVMLVDTPGIGETRDPIETLAVQRSAREVERADLVILALDPTQPLERQRPLMERHPGAIRVVNKSDLPPIWNAQIDGAIQTIATLGRGVDSLRLAILRHFQCDPLHLNQPRIWTKRQQDVLMRAQNDLSALAEL